MNLDKKWAIPVILIVGIGLLAATGFVVNSFVIKADVIEPFTVEYAILGDSGNWNGETCAEYDSANGAWTTYNGEVDFQGLYPGEARRFCVKIDNAGEGNLPYTIISAVETGHGNYADCIIAFPEDTIAGTALGSQETLAGKTIEVPANAPPVTDCLIHISVARG